MTAVRVRDVVTNPTERPLGAALPYVALENVAAGAGHLVPGTELEDTSREGTVVARTGDVLFGKLRPYLAKVLYIKEDIQCSTELLVMRADGMNMDKRFLYYLARSKPFVEWAVATSVGVKMPRTDWAALSRFELSNLPCVEDQRRLATRLDAECREMDAIAEEHENLSRLVEERDRTAVKRLVTGQDVDGPREKVGPWWLGPTPVSWQPYKVSRNFRTGSGATPTSGDSRFYDGPHPWLNTSECNDDVVMETNKTITDEAISSYSALKFYPAGSIVVAMYGATIGKLAVLGAPMTVNQACVVLYEPKGLDPWFTYWWLWAHRAELIVMGEGGGQPNISQETVKQFVIPAPSLVEQREVVERITAMRSRSANIRELADEQARLLSERREALVTSLVTGQAEVA